MDNIFGTLRKLWVVSAILLSTVSSYTLASPASLNFQGRIMKTDGHPLEHNAVSFIFQITNPTGSCIIYEEQVDGFNMTGSGGVFDVPIGLGSIKHPTGGSFTVLDAFNNSSTFICKGGALYNSASADLRKLRVQFYDGVGWRTISPDSVIRSVPYAAYAGNAEKLGNLTPEEFVQRAGLPLCGANSFLSWDGTQLTCAGVSGATGGTVTSVSKGAGLVAGAPITSTGTIAVDVGTGPNQVVQLDATSKLPAVDGSALTNLNPTHLGNGAIPTANLPAFTGDVTSTAGSNTLTLQTVPIAKGGTGATTREAGINALLPTQGSNATKILQTDGTNVSWVDAATTGLTSLSGDVVATGPGAVSATIQAGAVNSSKIADGSVLYGDLNFVTMTQNTGVVVTNGTSFNRKTCNPGETLLWDATNGWECASFSATESDPQVGSNTVNFLSKWNGSALVTSGVFENSGRVGIGNSAPSVALHVTGTSGNTLRIVDGNQAAGRVLSSDANGVATWVDSSTTGLAGITGDVVATGPGTASSTIQNGAVTSAKILDGTIAYGDLNFITMPVNSGIVVSNGTAFNNKQCGVGETLIWDITVGWKCGTFAASETDPKVGSNTANFVSKWNGSALVTSGIFDNGTNIGIGTASPSTTLHIAGSSGSTLRIVDGNQGAGKILSSDANGVASWVSPTTTGLTALTGDVVANGPGSASSTIQASAVNSSKIADGSVGYVDLNFGAMSINTGLVVTNGTTFNSKACGTGQTLVWDLTNGWTCGSFSANETDPKVGSNTTNFVSKWNGSALVASTVFDNGTSVGIGTSSPAAVKLHVAGTSGATLRIVDGNQAAGRVLVSDANGTATWTALNTGVASVTGTAPVVSSGGANPAISMAAATASVDGYLTAANFTTFNNKVTSVGGTAPIVSSGGTTPTLSMAAATASVDGYLTAANFTTFNNKSPAAGSTSITTLGTITTGTWNGSIIPVAYGGTGTNNGSITGTGALTFAAGGTNQSIFLTPSGSGYTILNGNVGIGTTPNTYKLQVNGDVLASGWLRSSGTTGWYNETYAGGWYMADATWIRSYGSKNVFVDQTMAVGGNLGVGTTSPSERLEVAGTVKATSFISTSDRRLKKDIVTVNGLDTILKLRGVKFNWRSDGSPEYGTIAQEVEAVLPDLVITDKKFGYKGVKYIGLIAPLIEATKDLNNKCDMSAEQIQNLAVALQNVKSDVTQIKRQLASVIDENAVLKEQLKALSSRLDKLEQKDK